MFGIGPWELAIVLAILLLLFGGSRLPEIAKSMGKSITEFKRGVKGIEDDVEGAGKSGDNSKNQS